MGVLDFGVYPISIGDKLSNLSSRRETGGFFNEAVSADWFDNVLQNPLR